MNESAVPVHTVGCPLGPNLESAEVERQELYASSTLSLGLPLTALGANPDLVGRHYLCDLSLAASTYREAGFLGRPLFAEQPVIKLKDA